MAENEREILIGGAEDILTEPAVEVDLTQVFEWSSDEFEYYEKGKNWKWGLMGVSAVFFVIFLIGGNYSALLLVLVGALVIYQYAFKKPRQLHYIISKDGLTIGEQQAGFDQFASYWISGDGFLYLNKNWRPRLTIKVDSVDVDELDAFLGNFLDKIDRSDRDSSDRWGKVLKL